MDKVICPHCGNEETEWYEWEPKEDDVNEIQCGWCENEYLLTMRVSYSFETEKI